MRKLRKQVKNTLFALSFAGAVMGISVLNNPIEKRNESVNFNTEVIPAVVFVDYQYDENTMPEEITFGGDDSEVASEIEVIKEEKIEEEVKVEVKKETKTETSEKKEVKKEEVTKTPEKVVTTTVSGTVYTSKPDKGFVVTTDNKKYSLTASDLNLLMAIVSAESDKSYDDALAVVSVILNRCENSAWIRSHGSDPISQATAYNQFVVYQHGYYKKYLDNAPETVQTAVKDALAGVRNHNYLSFRSNGSKNYSSNMITSTGNRYK